MSLANNTDQLFTEGLFFQQTALAMCVERVQCQTGGFDQLEIDIETVLVQETASPL